MAEEIIIEIASSTPVSSGGGAVDSVNGKTGVVTISKADVGLSAVDNTSDADKPVSTATATALANKVNSSLVGIPSGLAQLDATGKVPLANLPPSSVSAVVSVSGTNTVGSILTASLSSGWTATSYQWTRDGADIAGQTASTYTLVSADATKLVSCRAVGLSNIATGITIAAEVAVAPVLVTAPEVIGTPTVGTASSYTASTWTGAYSVAHKWQLGDDVNGTGAVDVATTATYTPIAGDVGKFLGVGATATNVGGDTFAKSAIWKAVQAAIVIPTQRKLYDAIAEHKAGTRVRPPIILGIGDSNFTGQGAGIGGGVQPILTGAFPRSPLQVMAQKLSPLKGCVVRTGAFFGEGNTWINGSMPISDYDSRLTLGTGWDRHSSTNTIGGRMLRSSTAGAVLTFNAGYPCDTVEVYFPVVTTASGTVEVLSSDDTVIGSYTSTGGAAAAGKITLQSSKFADGIVKFKSTTVSPTAYLIGAICYNSAEKSIIVCQGTRSGGVASNYSSIPEPWNGAGMARAIAPDLGIIALTLNEIVNNGSPATYKTNMDTIISQFTPTADIIAGTGFRGNGTNFADASTVWTGIATATKEVVDANPTRLLFKNMHEVFPSYSASQAAGYIVDDLHMTALGYAKQADEYAAMVTALAG